jgi:hypothetical protein
MLEEILEWSRECVSYKSPMMHVVEGISVVEIDTDQRLPR